MILLIGGDLVPTQSNMYYFEKGDITALLGSELLSLWNAADIRIFNLEVPLCDKEEPIDKCGPNHIVPMRSIVGLKAMNPSLVSLANNHILDQGTQGIKSTEQILSQNSIPFVGAGGNINEACKAHIIKKNVIRIGVYSCAEHEFSIATEKNAGANPFDPLESLDHIYNLKAECDFVIVLYHGGKEYYRYPSPYLQKACRKMVQKGADLVICQHSHCIGCQEKYQNSTIVYGQGNFIFDHSDSEFWKTSLLVRVIIDDKMHIEYIPIVKESNGVRLADEKKAGEILKAFHYRSTEIIKPEFIENQYKEFAKKIIYHI